VRTLDDRTTVNSPARVFQAIADRFTSRSADLARFAETRYSFEEWCNWEAYAAAVAAGWTASARPRYCKLSDLTCRDYGDLLVSLNGHRVLVEIGLVHDGTGDKWRAKLDWDMQKLARPVYEGVIPLQIIVLVSTKHISTADIWQRWLAKVPCWVRPTDLVHDAPLPPNGQMIIRGWTR
jgi:hypothetical protein